VRKKRIILFLVFMILFNIFSINSYATNDNPDYYQDNLDKYDLSDDYQRLEYHLDKVAAQYIDLCFIIAETDHYIFINWDCTWVSDTFQLLPDMVFNHNTPDEKIYYLNGIAEAYSGGEDDDIKYDEKLPDAYGGNNSDSLDYYSSELFNEWWYSLGPNYVKYIKYINDLDKAILKANIEIDKYNKEHNTNYDHINYIARPYTNFTYEEIENNYWNGSKGVMGETLRGCSYFEIEGYPVYPQG